MRSHSIIIDKWIIYAKEGNSPVYGLLAPVSTLYFFESKVICS